jgi:hypothetical protein
MPSPSTLPPPLPRLLEADMHAATATPEAEMELDDPRTFGRIDPLIDLRELLAECSLPQTPPPLFPGDDAPLERA